MKEKKVKVSDNKMIKILRKENDRILDDWKRYKDLNYKQEMEIKRKEQVIITLQSDYDYLKQINEADRYMLNFAKGQIDVYQRMTRTRDEDLLDCNQDCCCEN